MSTTISRLAARGFALCAAIACVPSIALAQGVYPFPGGAPDLQLRVTGTVEAVVPFDIDGVAGIDGYAIGGNFDEINGSARRNLALVDASGALLGWTADTDATVRALAVSGDALFVGGDFAAIGGTPRHFLGRVSLADGTVSPVFTPVVDNVVRAIAVDEGAGQVFVGGNFGSVNGTPRDASAKLDAATGQLIGGWVPAYADATQVNALLFDGSHLYVGGTLKVRQGGGHDRAFGRLNGTTGALDNWRVSMHPRGGAQVWTIAQDATHVYIGGQFRRIGGVSSFGNLARIAKSNASVDANWNPVADAPVRVIAVDGTEALIGGDFGAINGTSRQRLARVDIFGDLVGGFSANADRPVRAIALSGGQAVIGGAFRFVSGVAEEGLARIDAATGSTDASFTGTAGGPGQVNAFAFDGNGGVIAGGEFDFAVQAGDPTTYSRSNLLRLNPDFSLDTGWAADVSGDVQALAIDGTTLYIGGNFLQVTVPIGGAATARSRLAAYNISAATPVLLAWAPVANGDVSELVADAAGIYVGGGFTMLNASLRDFGGLLDPITGATLAWNPQLDGPLHALLPSAAGIFVGGDFSTAGGAARANLALLDATTGLDTGSFSADTDLAVRALVSDGALLYVGGAFTSVQGVARQGVARIGLGSGLVDGWNPSVAGAVHALAFDDLGWVHFGGEFAVAGGLSHPNLARASAVDTAGQIDPGWRPGTNGPVAQIVGISNGDILAGGDFDLVTGLARGGLAQLGPDGSDLTAVSIDSIGPSPSVAGQAWTVAYTVSNTSSPGDIPSGTVVVSTDAGESCAATAVDAAGQGSCAITSTLAGPRVVSVAFSAGEPELMDSATTGAHTVLAAAPTAAHAGTLIEATDASAVADGSDSGAVRVSIVDAFGNPVAGVAVDFAASGGASLGTASGSTDAAGQLSTTVTSLVAGTIDVTATFDADADGTSDTAVANGSPAQVVFTGAGSIATSIAITSDAPDASVVGQSYTVAFAVTSSPAAVGTVTVSDGAGDSCQVVLDSADGGVGACTLTGTFAGARTLGASFAGAGPFEDSASADEAHTVAQAQSALDAAADASIIAAGDAVTFSWTVGVDAPGAGTPSGTVTVSEPGGLSCSASVAAGSCQVVIAAAGNYSFTASYGGDADFLGDTDGPLLVDVQAGGTISADVAVRHVVARSGVLSNGSGDLVDYELEVSNLGPNDAGQVAVDMLMPAEAVEAQWTCAGSGGGLCGSASGVGDIAETVTLPAGASVLFTIETRIVDAADDGVETAAFAESLVFDPVTGNEFGTTYYRSCSSSEVVGDRPLPLHVCGFRDGFEGMPAN